MLKCLNEAKGFLFRLYYTQLCFLRGDNMIKVLGKKYSISQNDVYFSLLFLVKYFSNSRVIYLL